MVLCEVCENRYCPPLAVVTFRDGAGIHQQSVRIRPRIASPLQELVVEVSHQERRGWGLTLWLCLSLQAYW